MLCNIQLHDFLYTQKPFIQGQSKVKRSNNHTLLLYFTQTGVTLYCPTHTCSAKCIFHILLTQVHHLSYHPLIHLSMLTIVVDT